jgi:spore coat polysaccharide biosynthesis protein SpsF
VLKPILGRPMLELQVERIRQSRLIDRVIIATTSFPQDDPIAELAARLDCPCFRGSEDDVLGRVVGALQAYDVDLHVEFQGDNPMPDALLVDAIIGYYLKHADQYDYVTNALKTTYPPGAEVSVYPAHVLIDAERHAGATPLREHVGLHIHHTEEDFALVSAVFEHFHPVNPGFSLTQVIAFADARPDLAAANRDVERRWKVFRHDA